jgi:hypothetical protein
MSRPPGTDLLPSGVVRCKEPSRWGPRGRAGALGAHHARAGGDRARRSAHAGRRDTAHLLAEAGRALGLTPDQQMLGFHACWLHHASNELDRGTAGGPFTAVVRVLSPDERPV